MYNTLAINVRPCVAAVTSRMSSGEGTGDTTTTTLIAQLQQAGAIAPGADPTEISTLIEKYTQQLVRYTATRVNGAVIELSSGALEQVERKVLSGLLHAKIEQLHQLLGADLIDLQGMKSSIDEHLQQIALNPLCLTSGSPFISWKPHTDHRQGQPSALFLKMFTREHTDALNGAITYQPERIGQVIAAGLSDPSILSEQQWVKFRELIRTHHTEGLTAFIIAIRSLAQDELLPLSVYYGGRLTIDLEQLRSHPEYVNSVLANTPNEAAEFVLSCMKHSHNTELQKSGKL